MKFNLKCLVLDSENNKTKELVIATNVAGDVKAKIVNVMVEVFEEELPDGEMVVAWWLESSAHIFLH